MLLIFTASGKMMFSVMSIRRMGVPHVTITHDALDLAVQATP